MLFVLLAVSTASWLATAAVQASYYPYHGASDHAIQSAGLKLGHGPIFGSLAAQPIVVPDLPSRAIIGPSEGAVLVQGPQKGPATIIGPSEGAASIVGPSGTGAVLVGPSAGAATIIGPAGTGATVVGPTEGAARIVGPSSGGATVIGPTAGAASVVGPSVGPATIVGPSAGPASILGSSLAPGSILISEDSEARARAEAYAHALSRNVIVQRPVVETVYVKEVVPSIVEQRHEHAHYYTGGGRVVCAPGVDGVSTSAAVEAVARAGSRYGPVHVGSVLGRPVVTLSGGPPSYAIAPPSAVYLSGPSGSIGSFASASASASSSSSSSSSNYKKFWYPGPAWVKC